MTQITVSDAIAAELANAAATRGCSQEELATFLLETGLRDQEDLHLTPEQDQHIRRSIDQAARGEVFDGEIMAAKLATLIQQLESK